MIMCDGLPIVLYSYLLLQYLLKLLAVIPAKYLSCDHLWVVLMHP